MEEEHVSWRRTLMRTRVVVLVAALVVATGLGLGLGLGLGVSAKGGPARTASASVGALVTGTVVEGCQQWLRQARTATGTGQWCTDMARWMDRYGARHGVDPQETWGGPARLEASCERWLSTSPPQRPPAGVTHATGWCSAMVSWMAAHVSSWSGQATGGQAAGGQATGIRGGPMMGW
jgi:hypothetical protein